MGRFTDERRAGAARRAAWEKAHESTWRQLALFPVATAELPLLRQATAPAPAPAGNGPDVLPPPLLPCAYCGEALDGAGPACSPCLAEAALELEPGLADFRRRP